MDELTNLWNRCAFARICVRLDLSKKLPKGVWAHELGGSFCQPIEYEGIPLICLNCGKVGHKAEVCKESRNMVNVHPPPPTTMGPAPPMHRKDMEVDHVEVERMSMKIASADGSPGLDNEEQGEWTIVNRRRRPKSVRVVESCSTLGSTQLPGTRRRKRGEATASPAQKLTPRVLHFSGTKSDVHKVKNVNTRGAKDRRMKELGCIGPLQKLPGVRRNRDRREGITPLQSELNVTIKDCSFGGRMDKKFADQWKEVFSDVFCGGDASPLVDNV
ncbi:uncharacterized protein LOC114579331 [Dendrobium catenatum]|uniref:uncharacterized protein LOC114579331 n=1 Tax=Dendrobium catenatum TaxID=906689 RepID=UPI00109F107C|nr:uncharacterized protein LOC114579331 [Dendrobium catenatum]